MLAQRRKVWLAWVGEGWQTVERGLESGIDAEDGLKGFRGMVFISFINTTV